MAKSMGKTEAPTKGHKGKKRVGTRTSKKGAKKGGKPSMMGKNPHARVMRGSV